MRFAKLGPGFQAAFAMAWEAYVDGTVPIGAAILDAEGQVVATGRNRIRSATCPPPQIAGHKIAHAEINAILQVQEDSHPDIRNFTLFTTLEPCPLCFGAIVMDNIRHVAYAARDRIAGATLLADAIRFVRDKRIRFEGPYPVMEGVQIVWHTLFSLQRFGAERLLDAWAVDCPEGVLLGRNPDTAEGLAALMRRGASAEEAFDWTAERLSAQ